MIINLKNKLMGKSARPPCNYKAKSQNYDVQSPNHNAKPQSYELQFTM